MKTQVVVGAQYGSEAKGHITAQLIRCEVASARPVANIRVAGPNAGHSAVDSAGNRWALRSIPVGAVVDAGHVALGIAAGSEVDGEVLLDEFDRLEAAGLITGPRLMVDAEATVIGPRHKEAEAAADLTKLVGSTGKGIGAARADRLMRGASRVVDNKWLMGELALRDIYVGNVAAEIRDNYTGEDATVVIEGTQGYGLGLHAGHYPQCTSSDCRAIDFLAMAGINPWSNRADLDLEIWATARVYPIRVAGNSGPMKDETTWDALGLPEELTTVTQKVRRVGQWDAELVRCAVAANGGAPVVRLALTMLDQKFPSLANSTDRGLVMEVADDFIYQIARQAGARVGVVTTGPNTAVWL